MDGNDKEGGSGHKERDAGRNGGGNVDENLEDGGGERESENLRSDSKSGSEDAREGAIPTSN